VTVDESKRQDDVTYYTVAEAAFFLGAVMLVNSLRVTGNDGKIVVLDMGLEVEQRKLLERDAEVISPSRPAHATPGTMKPYPYLLGASGTVVVIDSDIVVTARLDDAFQLARSGKIVAAPAWLESVRHRWFAEWEQALQLRAPLRREEWFHNGFVVVDTSRWPQLLQRWMRSSPAAVPSQNPAESSVTAGRGAPVIIVSSGAARWWERPLRW
jgi:hypothetical protein